MGVVIFNGKSSRFYGVNVERFPDYEMPEKDYEIVHVPGRNGDITIDKGSYQNVNRTYEISAGSYEPHSFTNIAKMISDWLHSGSGYCKLTDSYEPAYYRLAMFKDAVTLENILDSGTRASISFNCKPQRFLISGDDPIFISSSPVPINNPSYFEAKPLIRVNGSGYGTLQIGPYVCGITLLNTSIGASTGVTRARTDGEEFMDKITRSSIPGDVFVFTCTGNEIDVSVTSSSSSPITAIASKSSFIEKVGTNEERSYDFKYYSDDGYAEVYNSSSLSNVNVSLASLRSAFNSDSIEIWSCSQISGVTGSYSGITQSDVTIDMGSFISAIRYNFPSTTSYGAPTYEIKYVSAQAGWTIGGMYESLSSFGITLAESYTPTANDKFSITITTTWKNENSGVEQSTYPYGMTCDGLASVGDSLYVVYMTPYWMLGGEYVVLSDYSITITGTPIAGDIVTVDVSSTWELNTYTGETLKYTDDDVKPNTFGIDIYGTPNENDGITITLGDSIVIDCDLQDSYGYDTMVNKNDQIVFQNGFPKLGAGETNISFSGGITDLVVTPKWWIL